jgi:large subunit ribosomal protein L10
VKRTEKENLVASMHKTFEDSSIVVITHYSGLTVTEMSDLRMQMLDVGAGFKVTKNRLARLAINGTKYQPLESMFTGPTAIAYSNDDPIAPAKILQDFAEKDDTFSIKTGIMDGKILTADEVVVLAKLPSRDELLGKVVGSIQSPLYGFAVVLNGLLRNLVGVVSAIEEKQRTDSGE